SKRKQLALVLRFVDKEGFIQERFFDLVYIKDTCALTLKIELLFENVKKFCDKYDIDILDLNSEYITSRYRSHHQQNQGINHYEVNIFVPTIDKQLQELNNRCNEQAMELLTLSLALIPKDAYTTYNIDNVCNLVEKYYPVDLISQRRRKLI
ncbi:DUF4371 domain-containing protein, partial [Cephalotus follicularis]